MIRTAGRIADPKAHRLARRLGIGPGGGPLLVMLLTLAASRSALAADQDQDPVLIREHRSLEAVCGKCHSLELVMDTPMGYENWEQTVQKMVDLGAEGTDDQFDDIMDYLHRTMTPIDVNAAGAEEIQIVLSVSEPVAKAIIARRGTRKFHDLADLKSVPGIDASALDARARLIFFQ